MKLESVKEIHIVFENSEEIHVPANDIKYMTVGNLYEDLRLNNILSKDNCRLERYPHILSFHIQFINKEEYKRAIKHTDVAQIHLYDDNGGTEWFFAPWGEEDYNNTYQITKTNNNIITIDIREENQKS